MNEDRYFTLIKNTNLLRIYNKLKLYMHLITEPQNIRCKGGSGQVHNHS